MTTINDRMSHAFGLDATGWTRHANPWSVYTRIPVPVLFAAAVWAREWLGWWCILSVAAVCLWAAVNPRAFPPPADLDSWASRELGALYLPRPAAAAYGIVTVGDALDRVAQVQCGRLLARLHLAATALGLGFHHMNQITERIDRDRVTGRPDEFSARWSEVLGIPASTGLVSFRVGHPERAAGPSPRRALADVRV